MDRIDFFSGRLACLRKGAAMIEVYFA